MKVVVLLVVAISQLLWSRVLSQQGVDDPQIQRLIFISKLIQSPTEVSQIRSVEELRVLLRSAGSIYSKVTSIRTDLDSDALSKAREAFRFIRQLLELEILDEKCPHSKLELASLLSKESENYSNDVLKDHVKEITQALVSACLYHFNVIISTAIENLDDDVKTSIDRIHDSMVETITSPIVYSDTPLDLISNAVFKSLKEQGHELEQTANEDPVENSNRILQLMIEQVVSPCQALFSVIKNLRARYSLCMQLKDQNHVVSPLTVSWIQKLDMCRTIVDQPKPIYVLGRYDYWGLKNEIFGSDSFEIEPEELGELIKIYFTILVIYRFEDSEDERKNVKELIDVSEVGIENCNKNFFRMILTRLNRIYRLSPNVILYVRYYAAKQVVVCIPTLLERVQFQKQYVPEEHLKRTLDFARKGELTALAAAKRFNNDRVIDLIVSYIGERDNIELRHLKKEQLLEHPSVIDLMNSCVELNHHMLGPFNTYHQMIEFNQDMRLEDQELKRIMFATNLCRRLLVISNRRLVAGPRPNPRRRRDQSSHLEKVPESPESLGNPYNLDLPDIQDIPDLSVLSGFYETGSSSRPADQ